MKPGTFPIRFVSRSFHRRGQFRLLPFFLVLLTAMLVFVVAASAASTFILKWGTVGSEDGQFLAPRGIAVDPSGNVMSSTLQATPVVNFKNSTRTAASSPESDRTTERLKDLLTLTESPPMQAVMFMQRMAPLSQPVTW